MSNARQDSRRAESAAEPAQPRDEDRFTNATGVSGTRAVLRSTAGARAQLPALPEESRLSKGEHATFAPVSPFEEFARSVMEIVDDDWDAAPVIHPVGEAAPATGTEIVEVQVESMGAAARFDLMAQIADCYLERLGSREAVPYVAVARRELVALALDHWTGFVLSLVDGATSVEDILDVSPMPEHEALHVLDQLQERGLIKIRAPHKRR
jgi:hypothetical protein